MRSSQQPPAGAKSPVFRRVTAEIGERYGDRDMMTMALNGQGRALIRMGEIARGVTFLDEAVVAVTSSEASPMVAGGVYCSGTESCRETLDIRRAREWAAVSS